MKTVDPSKPRAFHAAGGRWFAGWTRRSTQWSRRAGIALALVAMAGAAAPAQERSARANGRPAPQETGGDAAEPASPELTATDIGVRFTPAIAKAMSKRMTEQMKSRYGLDDEQVQKIEQTFSANLMKLANENAEKGRDAIEMMMATMIENDGRFPKEAAVTFAKQVQPLIPGIKAFFTDTAADIGKTMTIKQRLQFTGDMAAVTAGVAMFESRMSRWVEGKVGDDANPFFDRSEREQPSDAPAEPEDPNESPERRRARRGVDRWMDWQLNHERQWEEYVRNAVIFYDFDDKQKSSAEAILADCVSRAKNVKSSDWVEKVRENRIAERMGWQLDSKFHNGPWKYQLEEDYRKLIRPIEDIERELKRRIDGLPNSRQRAAAREAARKAMSDKGITRAPA